jgi:hypothetical protein
MCGLLIIDSSTEFPISRLPFLISLFGITDAEFERLIIHREDASIKAELTRFENQVDQIIRFEHREWWATSYKVTGLPEKRWIYDRLLTGELHQRSTSDHSSSNTDWNKSAPSAMMRCS